MCLVRNDCPSTVAHPTAELSRTPRCPFGKQTTMGSPSHQSVGMHLITWAVAITSPVSIPSDRCSVDSVERQGDTIALEYTSTATTRSEIVDEMGAVSGADIGLVDGGESASQLDVTILRADEKPVGTYQVKREWTVAVNNDEMTREEASFKVLQPLETTS